MSRSLTRSTKWNRKSLGVLALAATLTLSACGGDSDSKGAEGESVAAGASKEEYQAAFEEIDPITIITQTAGAQGTVTSAYFEAYQEAVSDWSGGKIEFETNYAYSVAPPVEVSDAVADGRLDMSYTIPAYQPDELPATNALIDLSISADQTPLVGVLQLLGWSLETSNASEEILDEYEAIGLHPLLPVYSLGPDALFCAEPRSSLADFKGVTSRMGARLHAAQFKALGMEGTSVDLSEMFEALQRGVVDCTVANPLTAALTGIFEIAPNARIAPSAGFAGGVGSMVINKDVWGDLPLAAQQLLHDRLDVFVKEQIGATLNAITETVESTKKYDGELGLFDDDVVSALETANEGLLEESRKELAGVDDPAAFVDGSVENMKQWRDVVTTDLGFDPDMTPEEFVTWYEENDKDLDVFDEFLARLFDEAMGERRPA
ncbi:TRAP transporter substrate-binding protein DctP [Nocardioides houyundeii]|uniref:TRAP transporter substrate-binding protein DctP n=1 Tax=Nocardioides houyundeii TaxID=2045452 RepID=UPI000C77A66A|nr:TRAP transporter substrate-binding protein DctP [Nocardioides houyundeii]